MRQVNLIGKPEGSPEKHLNCAATDKKPCPKKLRVVPLVIHVTDEKGEEHDVLVS